MLEADVSIVIRNMLLAQVLVTFMVTDHALPAYQRLRTIWKSIHAPVRKKEIPKKRSAFFEIDFTKFEP